MTNLTNQAKSALFATLPPIGISDFDADILALKSAKIDCVVVLDDDPTGTQTVHDIPVLTEWSVDSLYDELMTDVALFFILTNSRSKTASDAERLTVEIGKNLRSAATRAGKKILVISRSDSTLRGHFPLEIAALQEGLGQSGQVVFVIPAFFEGGRFTINDIHWVQEGDQLIPAAQTPFARDRVFGYKHSNIRHWIEEKSAGNILAADIKSLSIEDLRLLSDEKLIEKINGLRFGEVCMVNAADIFDLKRFCWALFQTNIDPVFRTAASFVSAIACQSPKYFLSANEVINPEGKGGLVIVGSYVPKTTEQLNHLLSNSTNSCIEINIPQLLSKEGVSSQEVAKMVDAKLSAGQTVVLYTSRLLVSAQSDTQNLHIGQMVSKYLCAIVKKLTVCPRYILTKGGITSSDITTEALLARRVLVLGQIMAGVPVWKLDDLNRFAGLCQIVFPGNVGDEEALTGVVQKLNLIEKK